MRKYLLIFVLLLFSFALIYAGGTQEKPGKKKEAAKQEVQREKTPIEIYNPGYKFPTEKIQLSYWHVLGSRTGFQKLAEEIAKEYSAIHPNVSIVIRSIPNAQQRAIWSAAFEAHTAPDIGWVEAQVGLMAGAYRPAPDWVVKMMQDTFTPYALSLSKVGGKYYGYDGCEIDVGQMLYYRKDLFKESGLDAENPPEYLPGLIEAAKKLTKVDSSGKMTQAGIALRYAGGH
ncbi:MAG: hypothetical protein DRP58_09955 [Spirochaetes bacterium]|nr:MAG: hypothetical protein DRP58_09955 [Spirochaetota bacterium]